MSCCAKNSLDFAKLGADFASEVRTQPLDGTFLIHKNQSLQTTLDWFPSDSELLSVASGEVLLHNTPPLASIYAGHQFGHFVPQLGDGRSCLIGQINGYELSLKGAGQTPYSRNADGRAVLRSSIREYLCSIAMHALGAPSTQALALVGSKTQVYRENIETGAIVTRVAPSHIRFGHFELFASRGQNAQVKQLADFVIAQYFPECRGSDRYADFLLAVVRRTARMIADWQAHGFAHGVMNTDNMSILGLTIDYGPFGFLETYNPKFVCNHSDYEARYAFDQQPGVAFWNLVRLSEALSSLINPAQTKAVLAKYQTYLVTFYSDLMRQKFGLLEQDDQDNALISQFFEVLFQHKKDYTNALRGLSDLDNFARDQDFSQWIKRYSVRINQENHPRRSEAMNRVNPKFILRNYLAEVAIRKAEDEQDYREIGVLFALLQSPFEAHSEYESYTSVAPEWARGLEVSCSS